MTRYFGFNDVKDIPPGPERMTPDDKFAHDRAWPWSTARPSARFTTSVRRMRYREIFQKKLRTDLRTILAQAGPRNRATGGRALGFYAFTDLIAGASFPHLDAGAKAASVPSRNITHV